MENLYSLKKRARLAGLLYLLLAITSIFGLMYVPSRTIAAGDIQATIHNIKASEILFRLGILSNLIYLICFIFLVLTLYHLFKEVNKKQALLMLVFVFIGIPIAFLNELNQLAILILLKDPYFLKASGIEHLNALVQVFMKLYKHGNFLATIFWGLWLLPFGYLVFRSGFIPRVLGVMLMIGCFGYLVPCIIFLLFPSCGEIVFRYTTIPSALAEVSIILWFLIKGVKEQKTINVQVNKD